jgi:periplasmic protein TonB
VASGTINLRFRPLGRGTFMGGFMLTVAVHAFLLALVYFAHVKAAPREETPRDIMVTRLVSLGAKRPERLLPRIVEPPPPKAPEPTIKVTDNVQAPPAVKEPPRPKEPERAKDLQHAMDRARRMAASEPAEGDPTGSRYGTSTEASTGDAYASIISQAVASHWSVPSGLTIGAVTDLVAEIKISINDSGEILSPAIRHSSGNSLFDDSCMQAIEATRRVQAPPPSERARWRRGVVLAFPGKDLAR